MAKAPVDQADSGNDDQDAGTWLSRIDQAQKDMGTYDKRCRRIRDKYRYEGSQQSKRRRFQLLWSNQEILRPSVYAKRPEPVVTNRWKDGDPIARLACELLERNLDFQFDICEYDQAFKYVRDDFLLYGRGVPRLRYEPVFDEDEVEEGLDGDDADPKGAEGEGVADADPDANKKLKFENVRLDHVQREDFIHPKSRSWEELPWVAYRAFLNREELVKRFGDELGNAIQLDTRSEREDGRSERQDMAEPKATVYEIWDKAHHNVLWIAKGYGEVLESDAPYLSFDGFFPSPRPAFGTLSTDSLEPIPDFVMYQDQAEEIDDLTARIASLSDSLKLVGFYPGGPAGEGAPEIERAVRPGFENKMIAVRSWAAFTEGGKSGVPIVWLPIENVAKILESCVSLRKQLLDDVYQITGISDIIRGDTEAEETAAAQGIKSQWGSFRLRERQRELARVARDVTRMAAQVISSQFQIETLLKCANLKLPTDAEVAQKRAQFEQQVQQWQMLAHQQQMLAQQHAPAPGPGPAPGPAPGQPPAGGPPAGGPPGAGPKPPPRPPQPPQPQWQDPGPTQEMVEGLLRDGITSRFLIDIETDSTIAADENAEKKARTEFLEAVSRFIVGWMPIVQQQPEMVNLAGQMLMFGVRAFHVGREMEEVIEQTMDKIAAQAGQPKPPGPEQLKAQTEMAKNQAEVERAKIDMQTAQMKAQADYQRAQLDAQTAQQQHQMEVQRMQMQAQIDERKMQLDHQTALTKAQLEQQKIQAQTHFDAQQMQGAHQLEQVKQMGQQKTLAQQMQLQEQKMVARDALRTFGEHGGIAPGEHGGVAPQIETPGG